MPRRFSIRLIPKKHRQSQRGVTLINLSIFLIALGIILGGSFNLYELYRFRMAEDVTRDHLDVIETALMDFFEKNGRFPCAASLTDPPDDSADSVDFAKEIGYLTFTNTCDGFPGFSFEGTWRQDGREGSNKVRIGAVPTRTLGIHDKYMLDGWGHRIVYAISTEATSTNYWLTSGDDPGSIYIIDDHELKVPVDSDDAGKDSLELYGSDLEDLVEDESVTDPPGGVIYALIAPGQDSRGAYNRQGNLIRNCKKYSYAWENCDYNRGGSKGDSIFVAYPYKQYNGDDSDFTATIRYKGKFQPGGNE